MRLHLLPDYCHPFWTKHAWKLHTNSSGGSATVLRDSSDLLIQDISAMNQQTLFWHTRKSAPAPRTERIAPTNTQHVLDDSGWGIEELVTAGFDGAKRRGKREKSGRTRWGSVVRRKRAGSFSLCRWWLGDLDLDARCMCMFWKSMSMTSIVVLRCWKEEELWTVRWTATTFGGDVSRSILF